jgi:hypothetical protein
MPQPAEVNAELPANFWKYAKVEWDDLSKPIVRHLIFVAGKERTRLPYMEAYSVTISHDFEKLLPTGAAPAAQISGRHSKPINSAPASISRRRGPAPETRERIVAEMKQMPATELRAMKEVAMEIHFGASRDTCRKAREEVLSEISED